MHDDLFPLTYTDTYFNAINFSNELKNDRDFGCFILDYISDENENIIIGFIIFRKESADNSLI